MKPDNVDFLKLLPGFMRDDKTVVGLSAVYEYIFHLLSKMSSELCIIPNVDNLSSDMLDELARSLNVYWYNYSADIETKRRLIRSVYRVYRSLGTPFAVEQVIQDYYGSGQVDTWHEYGGEPYFFRLRVNTAISEAAFYDMIRNVYQVKNVRSWLDCLITETSSRSIFRAVVRDRSDYAYAHITNGYCVNQVQAAIKTVSRLRSAYRFTRLKNETGSTHVAMIQGTALRLRNTYSYTLLPALQKEGGLCRNTIAD